MAYSLFDYSVNHPYYTWEFSAVLQGTPKPQSQLLPLGELRQLEMAVMKKYYYNDCP